MFRQDFVAGFIEALHRKDIGSGEAATKRNDLRLLRDFEKLTDGGTLDGQGALRVPRFPKRRHSILLDTRPDLNVRCETMAACFRVFQFQVSGFKFQGTTCNEHAPAATHRESPQCSRNSKPET